MKKELYILHDIVYFCLQASNSGRIVVIMLTGQRVEVTCDPQKVTAGDLFQVTTNDLSIFSNRTKRTKEILLQTEYDRFPFFCLKSSLIKICKLNRSVDGIFDDENR